MNNLTVYTPHRKYIIKYEITSSPYVSMPYTLFIVARYPILGLANDTYFIKSFKAINSCLSNFNKKVREAIKSIKFKEDTKWQ